MKRFLELNRLYFRYKKVIQNFFWRFLQIAGRQGIIFLIFILSAKFLEPEEFGKLNYVLAIIFFLTTFSDFGISAATSKYTTEYSVVDKKKFKPLLLSSLSLIATLSLLVGVFTVLFGKSLFKEYYIYILYFLPLIFLVPAISLLDGIYRGLKKFKFLSSISLTIGVVSIGFVYFLVRNYRLIGAIISQNLFYFVLFIALFIFYKEKHFRINKTVLMEVGRYSLVIGIASVSYFLYTRIDVIILGHFGYITEIGYYEIINKIFQILIVPFMIFGQVTAPYITSLFVKKKYDVINKYFAMQCKFILLAGVVISLLVFIIFPIFLKILLPKYLLPEVILMMNILLFLLPIKIIGIVINQGYITATGFAKIIMVTTLIGGISNILLDFIFIKIFGYVGVIWATLVVHSLVILISLIYFNYLIKAKNGVLLRLKS